MADKVIISKSILTDICDAIREKTNSTELIQTANIGNMIRSIETGGVDERFKQIVEGTITEVSDETITNIRDYSFYYCSELTSVDIPNATSIGGRAFYGCSKLTSVNIPNVTSIENYAFCSCTELTSVDFPNTISIEVHVFKNCSSLTTLILRSTILCTLGNTNAFSGAPIATSETDGFIYVPDELVEDYKVATNWVTYASKIKPISELPAEE